MFGRESPAKMLVSSGLPGGQRLGEGEVGGCCAGYCWLLLVAGPEQEPVFAPLPRSGEVEVMGSGRISSLSQTWRRWLMVFRMERLILEEDTFS